MDLFRNLGRSVERLKREVGEGESESATQECADCGRRLHAEHDRCPECGSEDVVDLD